MYLFKLFLYKINYFLLILFRRDIYIKGHLSIKNISICNRGRNNSIISGRHVVLENCNFSFQGDNHKVEFGDNIRLKNVSFYFEKKSCEINIGNGTWIGPNCSLSAMDNTRILIWEGTLFARNCVVRTSDSHIIKDEQGNVINKPTDIIIGNHVWLGEEVFVLKGAVIPDGCIVGARSVVTSSLMANEKSIVVGQPAKEIKRNMIWEL